MFDSINAVIEQGERLTQSFRPGKVCVGNASYPASFGRITFSERLGAGGFSVLRSCHCRILRSDIPAGLKFNRGDSVTVKLPLMGGGEEVVTLNVADSNSSSAVVITLNLEADPA